MTLNKAKEKLGKIAEGISDEELSKEIEMAEFIAEILILLYKKEGGYNGLRNA